MKYSLRSLFVVVTLVAVLLGGRIEYLRRWAAFHEREAIRSAKIIEQKHHIPADQIKNLYDPSARFQSNLGDAVGYYPPLGKGYVARIDQNFLDYDRHRKLAVAYRAAAYRPWSTIAEPTAWPRPPRHPRPIVGDGDRGSGRGVVGRPSGTKRPPAEIKQLKRNALPNSSAPAPNPPKP